jgi:hypothetical protein
VVQPGHSSLSQAPAETRDPLATPSALFLLAPPCLPLPGTGSGRAVCEVVPVSHSYDLITLLQRLTI